MTVTWDDPDDDSVTGYRILHRNRATDATDIFRTIEGDTGAAATSYTDTDVEPETRYVYRIKAINTHGLSAQSTYVDADTPAPPVPDKPTGLTGTVKLDSVSLSWDDQDDDSISGYHILPRNRAVDDTGSSGTSYTDTGVAAETRYVYRIKAINNHGLSERSSWFDADTPEAPAETQEGQQQSAPPAAPTGPLTAATHDQVLLSWDDPDDDSITGYRILRCPDADSLSVIVENTNSASTSYTDQDVEAETAYVYTVCAINESGAGEASESVGVTTQKAPEETILSLRQDGGICDRTDAVADAIVAAVDGVSDCEDITSAHLEEITSLNLEGQSIASLQSGDFAGLTGLTALALASNSLTELPAGVFDKLTSLQELSLASNSLDTLPDEVFDKLTVMTNLNLRTNSLDALRMGVFDKNTALTTLDLSVNPLTSLPSDVFDNLTALTTLDLQGNSLTGLPSGCSTRIPR